MTALDRKWRIGVLAATMAAILLGAVMLSLTTSSGAMAATTQKRVCQDKDKDCMFYPKGGWTKVKDRKASGDTYHKSRSKTKPAIFLAGTGPTIDIITAKGPNKGRAYVLVVDLSTGKVAKEAVFNLKAKRDHYKVEKSITGLQSDRIYGVAMVSLNGKAVAIDAVKSNSLAPPPVGEPPEPPAQAEPPVTPPS
jgi:hypothetical protein